MPNYSQKTTKLVPSDVLKLVNFILHAFHTITVILSQIMPTPSVIISPIPHLLLNSLRINLLLK